MITWKLIGNIWFIPDSGPVGLVAATAPCQRQTDSISFAKRWQPSDTVSPDKPEASNYTGSSRFSRGASRVLLRSCFGAPSWQRGPIGGGEHGNIWWQQTGAGATPWENKCLKASLCPSCWARCRPQQKQLLARWCFLASTAWNTASEAPSGGGARGGGVADYYVRWFVFVFLFFSIWVGLWTLVARLWWKIR